MPPAAGSKGGVGSQKAILIMVLKPVEMTVFAARVRAAIAGKFQKPYKNQSMMARIITLPSCSERLLSEMTNVCENESVTAYSAVVSGCSIKRTHNHR